MVTCPFCNNQAELVNGTVIYPHRPDLYDKKFWLCAPCDAYVGCHKRHQIYSPNGSTPLGTLANPLLREMRRSVHDAFDPLWKQGPFKSRKKAYVWLSRILQITFESCHIALFDLDMCKKARRAIAEFMINEYEQRLLGGNEQ